jgi:hypothetical protein
MKRGIATATGPEISGPVATKISITNKKVFSYKHGSLQSIKVPVGYRSTIINSLSSIEKNMRYAGSMSKKSSPMPKITMREHHKSMTEN